MLEWFDYGGHICIAFEMLGLSVFDFMVRDDCRRAAAAARSDCSCGCAVLNCADRHRYTALGERWPFANIARFLVALSRVGGHSNLSFLYRAINV